MTVDAPRGARPTSSTPATARRQRPDHFSTYVPRDLVRRVKVVAALTDTPVWTLVTEALEQYLTNFEDQHGRLPALAVGTDDRIEEGG